jgi:hypothetical protein
LPPPRATGDPPAEDYVMCRTTLLAFPLAAAFGAALLLSTMSCSFGQAPMPGLTEKSADGGVDGVGSVADAAGETGALPFAPVPANVYLAKVKNLLVGLPPTDSELHAVEADPTQLGSLVDGWMQLPQYQTKMWRFFELAFQQTQVVAKDFTYMTFPAPIDQSAATQPLMLQNLQESIARTVFLNATATPEVPFNQAMSTRTIAMTTALKAYYAFQDAFQVGNNFGCGIGGGFDSFGNSNPNLKIYVTATSIPLSGTNGTLDQSGSNYMHWSDPDVAQCKTDPLEFAANGPKLYGVLFGQITPVSNGQCGYSIDTSHGPLQAADFQDWTMTTVRLPSSGEPTTAFYDLPTLRNANELVLSLPHVGFLTPAFFANWQTNMSNQMRVTMNQAFIVATGAQVDGTDPTTPTSTPGLDSVHAAPNTPCFGCHQLLDPSRSILAATYSFDLGKQTDTTFSNQLGLFAFRNQITQVKSVYDLGQALASHPLVAEGWAQKLCYYFNSNGPPAPNQPGGCVEGDPVFTTIVNGFKANFSWNQLVKAVVTSPLTTYAAPTLTATTNGETVAVSRRDHLCAAWNARLGFQDVCGQNAAVAPVFSKNSLYAVKGLPSDGYARGSTLPVLPNAPTLFYRGGTENLCEALAQLLIDNKSPPPPPLKTNIAQRSYATWSSTNANQALADFVSIVMGIPPSDPRSAGLLEVLTSHFANTQSTAGATAALQSAFTVACMAPTAVGIGL